MKKILKWLDNYWYHYKWATIIVTASIVVLVIMISQFATREKVDVSLIYAGPQIVTANARRDAETEIAKLLDSDLNGDGKKNCAITDFYLLTEAQIAEIQRDYDEKQEVHVVNRTELAGTETQFTNQISAGDASIMMLDPYWYDRLKKQNLIVPLDEILDDVPDYAADEFSVRLCDTPFAGYFTALRFFPDDTVLCLRRLPVTSAFTGKSSAEKQYEASKELFRKMIGFSVDR